MIQRLILLFIVSLLLTSCGLNKAEISKDAQYYFQEGERLYEKGLYSEALTAWEKVRDSYFSPELNMLAEMKIADTYYAAERYPEAASAYADFLQQHPNDERSALVTYRLGMSNYQQILVADRDQTSTEKALRVFEDFLRNFPLDPRAIEVQGLVQACRSRLVEHEIYVGRFYLRTDHYHASAERLEKALATYPEAAQQDEAYYYLGRAYLKMGQQNKARAAFQKLFEQFPGSDFLDDARDLLNSLES